MLHIAHAVHHNHHWVKLRTMDTDVVVFAVMVAQTFQSDDELWVAFGTGKNYLCIPAHEIAASLGPEKARALPMFHTFTACDTMSAFVGHGKKSVWATWNSFLELTSCLLTLSSTPKEIREEMMQVLEQFVILLYHCMTSHVNA